MSKSAMKKTAKKTTKKVAKQPKTVQQSKPAVSEAHPSVRPSINDELKVVLAKKPKTPKEANEQLMVMLRRLIGDAGRHEAQINYLNRMLQDSNVAIGEQLNYIENCLGALFAHAHLDPPKRMPAIRDAKVELLTSGELVEGEELDMRVAYSAKAHPIRGHYEVILNQETIAITKLHPKVVERLVEAFNKRIESKTLQDGEFYYVRLHTIHSERVSDDAVQVDENYQPVKVD